MVNTEAMSPTTNEVEVTDAAVDVIVFLVNLAV